MNESLVGRRCVVTGASSGIGRASAIALASAGASVMISARQNAAGLAETLEQLAGPATSEPNNTLGHAAHLSDLSTAEGCRDLIDRVADWSPQIDAWVHCAGADVLTGAAREWSFDQKLDALWRTDVQGTIRIGREVTRRMSEQSRATESATAPIFITIGWDQAAHGMSGDAGLMFGPIKGAVMAFSLSLARTVAPRVRVVCVAPGWIRTAWGDETSDYWHDRAKRESLMARWGRPEDVAAAIRFLVSDEGAFMTGHVLPVNGGFRHEFDGET